MVTVERPGTTSATALGHGRSKPLRAVVLAVAVVPPVTQIAYLVVHERRSWPLLFADDAFYYFGVARNIGTGHGSTFSGLVETNGYHPLWMLVLSAVAAVVRDPYRLLAAVVVLQCVLWLGVVREALRIGRLLGSVASAVAGVAVLGVLAVITGQLSFSGMESGPLLLLFLVAIRLTLQMDERADARADLTLGLVLALVCLTRLDAFLTALPLAAVAARRGAPPWGVSARRAARLIGPTAVGLAGYVAFSLVAFGTPTPVSGQAKSLGAPFANFSPVEQFLKAGQVGQQSLWFGVGVLIALAAAFLAGTWRESTRGRRLMGCALALLVGQGLLLGYLVVATSYPVWAWYHYNVALLAFCAGCLLALWATRTSGSAVPIACLVVGSTFAIAVVPATFWSGFSHRPEAIDTAQFVAERLPEDAILAMGDRAGLIGYLSNRPMLQLEGLMADAEWLDDLEDGTARQRMARERVDTYLWAGGMPGPTLLEDGRSCRRLTEPRNSGGPRFVVTVCDEDLLFQVGEGNDVFTIWHYRPELNRG
jgi:hypothetical protein